MHMRKVTLGLGVVVLASIGATLLAQTAGAPPKLTAQDLLDIRQLIDAYPHLLDNCVNNGDDYADLYTADATFGVSQEWGKAKIWFRGREQLRRAGGGTETACRPSQSQGHAYHLNINPTITATPTGAHATSTLLTITNDTNNRGDIVHWEGGYEDTFEKTPAGWKFKSRVHVWPEVAWTDRVEDMPQRKLDDE
jgi:SnoaL-like domain